MGNTGSASTVVLERIVLLIASVSIVFVMYLVQQNVFAVCSELRNPTIRRVDTVVGKCSVTIHVTPRPPHRLSIHVIVLSRRTWWVTVLIYGTPDSVVGVL